MDLEPAQQEGFQKLKAEIATLTVLAHHYVSVDSKISADPSSHGLGAILLQLHKGTWRPVALLQVYYLTLNADMLQLRKSPWACDRFSEFVLGKLIHLETDHKLLILILGKKSLL